MKLSDLASQLNDRVRLGIACTVALLWLFILLDLTDTRQRLLKEERLLERRIAQMQTLSKEEHWTAYKTDVEQRLTLFRSRCQTEESDGRIQAHFQDWLRNQMQECAIEPKELDVSLPLPIGQKNDSAPTSGEVSSNLPQELRTVRAKLEFPFKPDTFHLFLARIIQADHWVWCDQFTVKNYAPHTVYMEVEALYAVGAGERL